jgi:hypothetical protein
MFVFWCLWVYCQVPTLLCFPAGERVNRRIRSWKEILSDSSLMSESHWWYVSHRHLTTWHSSVCLDAVNTQQCPKVGSFELISWLNGRDKQDQQIMHSVLVSCVIACQRAGQLRHRMPACSESRLKMASHAWSCWIACMCYWLVLLHSKPRADDKIKNKICRSLLSLLNGSFFGGVDRGLMKEGVKTYGTYQRGLLLALKMLALKIPWK